MSEVNTHGKYGKLITQFRHLFQARGGGVLGRFSFPILGIVVAVIFAIYAIGFKRLPLTPSIFIMFILFGSGWFVRDLFKRSVDLAKTDYRAAFIDPIDLIQLAEVARKGLPPNQDSPVVPAATPSITGDENKPDELPFDNSIPKTGENK